MSKGGQYETHDLYLAAYLRSKGFLLSDVRPNGAGRVAFVFRDKPERPDLILSYYNTQGTVEPLTYANALKDLKALTFNV